MPRLPFSLSKRKGRRFFYVQFKTKQGAYLPAVSTRQTSEEAAIETAFKWYREGKPSAGKETISLALQETLREMNLPAASGGVSYERCIIYEVRSARKL
jgi:hypothetical protein